MDTGLVLMNFLQLAMAEIYKIVPELLSRFEISMPEERSWTAHNASFNLTSGVICEIKRRCG